MKKFDRVQKAIIITTAVLMLILSIIIISIAYANMDKDLSRELSKLPAPLVETFDGEIVIVDYISENIDGQYFLKSHKIEILSNCHSLAHELCGHYYYNEFMSDNNKAIWENLYNEHGAISSYGKTNSEEAFCESMRYYYNGNKLLKLWFRLTQSEQYDFISNLF